MAKKPSTKGMSVVFAPLILQGPVISTFVIRKHVPLGKVKFCVTLNWEI